MSAAATPATDRAVDKRQRILDAALALFVTRGFHGTAVPLISEQAEVAIGTIYRHFKDKDELVNVLYRTCKTELTSALFGAPEPPAPWRTRFGRIWRRLFQFAQEHPHKIEFLELQLHGDYLDAESRALEQATAAHLFAFIAEAQADEAMVEMTPIALLALVYGAFLGVLRASASGWLVIDDALIAASEERVWALIRR